jgi:hypothetical protein
MPPVCIFVELAFAVDVLAKNGRAVCACQEVGILKGFGTRVEGGKPMGLASSLRFVL